MDYKPEYGESCGRSWATIARDWKGAKGVKGREDRAAAEAGAEGLTRSFSCSLMQTWCRAHHGTAAR